MGLKISVSSICAVFLAVHLFVPSVKLDAISLGLIVIALLPWFQPLIKSLELPGGVKIELQDVKSATDKLSESAVSMAGMEAVPERSDDGGALSFVTKVSEQDPNLALVGLRIELEKRLVEIAGSVGVSIEGRSAGSLLRELSKRKAVPGAAAQGLAELIALGNRAAHGAQVSKEAAAWALDLAPQILGALASLRPKSVVTVSGEVPKAEAIGAFKSKSSIRIDFPRPFVATPQIAIRFEASGSQIPSGSVQPNNRRCAWFRIQRGGSAR